MFNVLWWIFPSKKDIGEALIRAWYGLCELLDTLVYNLISIAYQIFSLISRASLFNGNSGVSDIVERFSIILGIGMLFVLAYNIILLIMNPDKVSSGGDKSLKGIAKNFVIAVVMLTCYSTVFTYMTKLQNDIIESQIIENIILGGDGNSKENLKDMGSTISTMIFSTFYHPTTSNGDALTYQDCLKDPSQEKLCESYVTAFEAGKSGNVGAFVGDSTIFQSILSGGNFEYLYIISTICGVIALLMFVSYTIDIGIRVAKLAFLQIIAPIPIMLYVTKPNGGIFSKWINNLIKTYLTLFIRLATIYLAIFMINVLIDGFTSNTGNIFGDTSNVPTLILLFAQMILILGVLLFAKEAPKLFEELTGAKLSGDGGSFSPKAIGKRLAGAPLVGGALAAGAHKVNQAMGAGAGAAGAAFGAWRNNRVVARGGKGAEGLTHMDVKAAVTQGRHNGWKKGGIKQFNAQGQKVYEETYGYGKKQGVLGGKSWSTKADEKYGKAYSNSVKEHAAARNEEIKNAALAGNMPENELQSEINKRKYETQNTDFATTSDTYKNAATFVDNEAAKQGITLTPAERKAKINERLSQIAATTTNENEKRSINSYLKRENIVSQYEGSILNNAPEAVAKVKSEARIQTEVMARNEIATKGVNSVITDASIRTTLQNNAKTTVDNAIKASGGDLSKLNISEDTAKKITADASNKINETIEAAGGINNVAFTTEQKKAINARIDSKVNDKISASGGLNNISLNSANQAKFDSMNSTFIDTANSKVDERLNNEFTSVDEARIRNEIMSNPPTEIGGVAVNLSPKEIKEYADKKVAQAKAVKRQQIVGEIFDKVFNDEKTKAYESLVKDQVKSSLNKDEIENVMKETLVAEESSKEIKKHLLTETYKEEATKYLTEQYLNGEKYKEVETRMMQEATTKALEDVRNATSEYIEGKLNGTYSDNVDGSKDKLYNEEYVQNEKIHSNGVKTKSAEDIAFENIKKWVKEQEKGDKSKDDKK